MTTASKVILGLLAVATIVVLGFVVTRPSSSIIAGGINPVTNFEQGVYWFKNAVYFGTTQQAVITRTGAITAPSLTLTSTTGTSTLSAGCVQVNATSTATAVKLVFSTLGATSTFNGTAYWRYGTCP